MFHYVRGVPFEFNSGAYDNLTMWEQIDDGAQYTPAKKFLLSVPIVLFLLSTHYTHYDLKYFTFNFIATLAAIVPKLPFVSFLPSLVWTPTHMHTEPPNTYQGILGASRGSVGRLAFGRHGLISRRWGMRVLEIGAATGQGGKHRQAIGTAGDSAGEETEVLQGWRGNLMPAGKQLSRARLTFASGRNGLGRCIWVDQRNCVLW